MIGGIADVRPEELSKPGFADEALPHLEAVYRFALRLTAGRAADAEDLVQETFLRAYRSWDTYERGTSCRSWLFTICRNVFLRTEKRRGRTPESTLTDLDADVEALAATAVFDEVRVNDPEQRIFASFVDEEVTRAVDQLPPEFRQAVVLSVEGLDYAEIARVLGVPLGTVKSRLFRGRRLLQEALFNYALEMGYLPKGREV